MLKKTSSGTLVKEIKPVVTEENEFGYTVLSIKLAFWRFWNIKIRTQRLIKIMSFEIEKSTKNTNFLD